MKYNIKVHVTYEPESFTAVNKLFNDFGGVGKITMQGNVDMFTITANAELPPTALDELGKITKEHLDNFNKSMEKEKVKFEYVSIEKE